MIVAGKSGQVLAGDFQVVTPNLLFGKENRKLYKATGFKPWAVFSTTNTLQSVKVISLTNYDPLFLVIKEAEKTLALQDKKAKELDDIFSAFLLDNFKETAISVCDSIATAGGSQYYRVSEAKVIDAIVAKLDALTEKLIASKIPLRQGKLQKEGDLSTIRMYALDILKLEVSEDVVRILMKNKPQIGMSTVSTTHVLLDEYKQWEDNLVGRDTPGVGFNAKRVTPTNKLPMSQEKLQRAAKGSSNLASYFKKP